ncbi:MAG: nuclear transport factor 2 family protein [Cocleimonas sp.]
MEKTIDNFYFATAEEAESAFYSAFEMADIGLMNSLMADDNVSCIHPNALPIIGRIAVLASWQKILSSLAEPAFYPEVIHSSVEGDEVGNTAIHLVAERIAADHKIGTETSLVIATNVYIKQKNGWRMMMHHSSLPPYAEEDAIENDPSITHSAPQTMQ